VIVRVKNLLYSRVASKTFISIVLVLVLVSSVAVGIFFFSPSSDKDIIDLPNQATPTPTQTSINTATPEPVSPSPTASKSLQYTIPTATQTPFTSVVQKGLLDDLADQQKTEYQTNAHAALGNWSSYFEFAPQTWTSNTTVRFGANKVFLRSC
jgi:hypothetical protein